MGITAKNNTLWFLVVEYLGFLGGDFYSTAKYVYEQLST